LADLKFPKASRTLSKKEKEELVAEVREHIEDVYLFELENRREASIDLQFLSGDQWPAAAKALRGTTRPMLTINQLPQFVRQVTNPTREANIAIKVAPVDDDSDPQKAKIFDGVIKQIEDRSTAKTVYVWGNECQAGCGIGWWQVKTQYVDDASFDQEIILERIENPLSVYCDTAAVKPDRSDAMRLAVIENWPRKTFKKRYPKAAQDSVDRPEANNGISGNGFTWSNKDTIAVAMYFRKVPVIKKLALTQSGQTVDITKMGEAEAGALDAADPIQQVREAETYQVEKYLMTGSDVLEGPIDWAGKYIPVVPVIGAEIPLKTSTMRYGVVRFARDPQQIMNVAETAAAEAIAMAPKTPWLTTPTMIGKFKQQWDNIGTTNQPYLMYEVDSAAAATGGMPKRESGPEIPAALLGQSDRAAENMKRVTGIYEASLGQRSNETSGIAIQRRQTEGDTANSHFQDNLMHSLVYTGRILVDLIPKIYDNQRVMRLNIEGQDKPQKVSLNTLLIDPQTNLPVMGKDGKPVYENDLSVGAFDIRVTVGKSFVTKRAEALQAMMEFAKTLPPQAQLLFLDMIVKNSDWPEADMMSKRLRTLIPPAALADPDDPNAPKPPGPMDDPMMVAKLEELAAKIEDLKASTRLKDAQAEKALTDAGVAETGVHIDAHQQLMEDWQAGHPSPGNPPSPGVPPPPPAQGEGAGPPIQGGSLTAGISPAA
jgi:hypothetical protein